jgi:hypothetical protein
MSADNGYYVAEFPDGFRVTCAGAIENIDYYPEGSKERKEELKSYFGESPIFKTREEALSYASDLEKKDTAEGGWTEYGICFVGSYESWKPDKRKKK